MVVRTMGERGKTTPVEFIETHTTHFDKDDIARLGAAMAEVSRHRAPISMNIPTSCTLRTRLRRGHVGSPTLMNSCYLKFTSLGRTLMN